MGNLITTFVIVFVFTLTASAQQAIVVSEDGQMMAVPNVYKADTRAEALRADVLSGSFDHQPPPTITDFSGILRSEHGFVTAWFDRPVPGTVLVLCNILMVDGRFCNQPFEFSDRMSSLGSVGFGIPIVPNLSDQRIVAIEITPQRTVGIATINLDPYNPSRLITAAYEEQSGQAAGPFTPANTTVLKIVGDFDPYAKATVQVGYHRINVRPVTQSSPNSKAKESSIVLDNSLLDKLSPTYRLTICQYGTCDEITVERSTQGGRG